MTGTRTTAPASGPQAGPPPGAARPRRAGRAQRFRRDRFLLLLALPGIAVVLLFHYLPLAGNVIAFKDYQPYIGINDSPWVGFANFSVIWNGDPEFLNALTNTLVISFVQVAFVFPIPIALALLLNSLLSERLKRLVQSVLYLPHFMSWVVVVAIFQQMLGNAGLLNTFLRTHELGDVSLLGNPDLFIPLITAQVIWKDAGWGTIIFLAALSRVDTELYEASAVDGASRWRQLWHVTLPSIRGVVVLLLILKLGDALTVGFEQIILQRDSVGADASEVLDTYVYYNGVIGGDWGVAAAVGLVKGLVGLVLVYLANKFAHLLGESGVYQK
ncbi:ABC transporter permease [Glycomyces sp. MUSA5-2]|uniref:ABC transporter permease n=1 Tax=Glycomyces sp. MUSA5-2 TaxID=2053002 RepID=UPI00300853DA